MKCAYCGKYGIDENAVMAGKSLEVCGEECRQKTDEYMERDQKNKLRLFLLIFAAAIGVIVSALTHNSVFAYAAQLLFGAILIIYPYPAINASTFTRCSIITMKRVCRALGISFMIWSIILYTMLPDAIFSLLR